MRQPIARRIDSSLIHSSRSPVKEASKKKRARHTKLIVSKNFIHRAVIFSG
jgi:hypothetical protein